jgi:ABC-type Mn2+/Zn2+ transport system permease subunit
MATERTGGALAIGWTFGFTASVVGLLGSVQLDLPAAPSILVALTANTVSKAAIAAAAGGRAFARPVIGGLAVVLLATWAGALLA